MLIFQFFLNTPAVESILSQIGVVELSLGYETALPMVIESRLNSCALFLWH